MKIICSKGLDYKTDPNENNWSLHQSQPSEAPARSTKQTNAKGELHWKDLTIQNRKTFGFLDILWTEAGLTSTAALHIQHFHEIQFSEMRKILRSR